MTLLFNCVNVGVRWMFLTACSPQTAALLPAIVSGRRQATVGNNPVHGGLATGVTPQLVQLQQKPPLAGLDSSHSLLHCRDGNR
jgi:hypothetical protein